MPPAVTATTLRQGPARSPEVLRAEAVGSLGHLPADTKAVITVSIDDILGHEALAKIVRAALADARITALLAIAPPCARTLVGDSDWLTYGAPKLGDSDHGTMIVGGRWTSEDVATCFSATAEPGAAGVWQIHNFGFLARIDAHAVLLTTRHDLDPPALAALAARSRTEGPPAAIRAALAALPADRAIGVVVDRTSGDDFSATLELPAGTGLAGSLRVEKDGVALDAIADSHDVALATSIEGRVRPQLAPLALFGDLAITRKGSALRLAGHLSDGFFATLAASTFGKP